MLKVLVCSHDRLLVDALTASGLEGGDLRVVSSCRQVSELSQAAASDLDAVLVDSEVSGADGAPARLSALGVPVYLMAAPAGDPVEVWRRARSRGFAGVAPRARDAGLVAAALDGVRPVSPVPAAAAPAPAPQASASLPKVVRGPVAGASPLERAMGSPARPSEEVPEQAVLVAKQEVVAVYSPKGGVGKTMLATNLAVALRPPGVKLSVGLVDMDMESCGVVRMMGIPRDVTLADWASLPESSLTPEVVRQYMVEYRRGVYVLPAPARPEDVIRVDEAVLEKAVHAVTRAFDVVVLDCSTELRSDATMVALSAATKVLLVSWLEAPVMSEVLDALPVLTRLGVAGKLTLVLNQVPRHPQISLEDVAAYLPPGDVVTRWRRVIPYDPQARTVAGRAELPVLVAPSCPFAREVRQLAAELVPVVERAPRRGLLAGLFGRRGAA